MSKKYLSNLKELKTGKDWVWVARTPSNKYIKDYKVVDPKSHKYNKNKKEKDQETINSVLAVPATGKDDKEAYNTFIELLKTEKGFSDTQIKKLTIDCIPSKELKNIKEQKQLRLDSDEETINLASSITDYLSQDKNYILDQSVDTIDVYLENYNNPILLCEVLFWNKEYLIFVPDHEYYYIGRTLEEFEKDFKEIDKQFEYDSFFGNFDFSCF